MLVALTGSACGAAADEPPAVAVGGGAVSATPSATDPPITDPPTPAPTKQPEKNSRVRIAFGGDVHFAGSSAAALDGDFGTAMSRLKSADLAIVNLETAITTRGTAAPKEYNFRAPARGMAALRKAGVDVVSLANNHGMDFGRVGLADTLAAGKKADLPVIGAGADVTEAFTPYRTTVRGVRIAVLGATDVLDSFAINTWTATETESGLASAKDPELLLAAVRSAAAKDDVVVVVLHWGVELQACPTERQETLARLLTEAGADVIVGSHAHVLQPSARQGRTAIHYGLGNFVFYATKRDTIRSGVYSVVVDQRGVVDTTWNPAEIRGGRPDLLTGSAARSAAARQEELARECGLR